jgi:hypothetical protein
MRHWRSRRIVRGGFEGLDDFLGEHIETAQIVGLSQAFVSVAEDVDAGLVAINELGVIVTRCGKRSRPFLFVFPGSSRQLLHELFSSIPFSRLEAPISSRAAHMNRIQAY